MYSIYFTVCSLFFCVLLIFAYFLKKRVKKSENIFYSAIVVTTFLGLIFESISAYLVLGLDLDDSYFIYRFVVKTIYGLYLFWVSFIFLYFATIILKKDKKKRDIIPLMAKIMTVLNVLVLFLPLNAKDINGIPLPGGLCVTVVDCLAMLYMIAMSLLIIIYGDSIKLRERIPVLFSIILFYTSIYLQLYAQLFLTFPACTFVAFIMYFTIENPDYKMLEQVELAKTQADKANMAKTDFLSSMSHEIRTPLNAIIGFSEGLKDKNLPDDAKTDVDDIISASETLLETVNGILDISKIEANKIEIVETDYDFDKLFNDLVTLSKARLGEDKPIIFNYNKAENVPRFLHGDHTRIKQVAINLLTNAIKYTKQGNITLDINCIIDLDTCKLIIKVQDTGIGIKEESINKLFSKFERLDNENSNIEGTGLGLAITKKLVELMNGHIAVSSKYKEGSTFTVTLDQKIVNNPIETTNIEDKQLTIDNDLSNKKVLVVDDNKLNLKVTRNLLKPYNIVPIEITSGFDCLDLINAGNKYDLILMDDMMPEKSGKETFKELKQDPNFNTPVVALTANAIDGMREEYLALGFDDYLAKPIDRKELITIIKKFLDN